MIVRDSNFVRLLAEICEDQHTGPESLNDFHVRDLVVDYMSKYFPGTQLQEHHLQYGNLIMLKVRDVLVEDGFSVVPVNERYFISIRKAEAAGDSWPQTEAQARKCIARGSAKSVGLHFHTGPGDLLFETYMLSHTQEGAAKYAKNVNKLVEAMDKGTLAVPNAGRILSAAQRRLVIENPDAVRRAIEEADDDSQLEIEGGQ